LVFYIITYIISITKYRSAFAVIVSFFYPNTTFKYNEIDIYFSFHVPYYLLIGNLMC